MSQKSSLKLVERGWRNLLLLIPGWAADWRIFSCLDLPYNYLIPEGSSFSTFRSEALSALRNNRYEGLSVLGWSMGSILACELARACPGRFEKVFLVSARPRYEKRAIDNIKRYLSDNPRAYLRKFYNAFFSESEETISLGFRKGLMREYVSGMDASTLMEGLDYILEAELKMQDIKDVDTIFVHGTADRIAPVEEAMSVSAGLPRSRFVPVDGAGHAPFLRPDFREILCRDR